MSISVGSLSSSVFLKTMRSYLGMFPVLQVLLEIILLPVYVIHLPFAHFLFLFFLPFSLLFLILCELSTSTMSESSPYSFPPDGVAWLTQEVGIGIFFPSKFFFSHLRTSNYTTELQGGNFNFKPLICLRNRDPNESWFGWIVITFCALHMMTPLSWGPSPLSFCLFHTLGQPFIQRRTLGWVRSEETSLPRPFVCWCKVHLIQPSRFFFACVYCPSSSPDFFMDRLLGQKKNKYTVPNFSGIQKFLGQYLLNSHYLFALSSIDCSQLLSPFLQA